MRAVGGRKRSGKRREPCCCTSAEQTGWSWPAEEIAVGRAAGAPISSSRQCRVVEAIVEALAQQPSFVTNLAKIQ